MQVFPKVWIKPRGPQGAALDTMERNTKQALDRCKWPRWRVAVDRLTRGEADVHGNRVRWTWERRDTSANVTVLLAAMSSPTVWAGNPTCWVELVEDRARGNPENLGGSGKAPLKEEAQAIVALADAIVNGTAWYWYDGYHARATLVSRTGIDVGGVSMEQPTTAFLRAGWTKESALDMVDAVAGIVAQRLQAFSSTVNRLIPVGPGRRTQDYFLGVLENIRLLLRAKVLLVWGTLDEYLEALLFDSPYFRGRRRILGDGVRRNQSALFTEWGRTRDDVGFRWANLWAATGRRQEAERLERMRTAAEEARVRRTREAEEARIQRMREAADAARVRREAEALEAALWQRAVDSATRGRGTVSSGAVTIPSALPGAVNARPARPDSLIFPTKAEPAPTDVTRGPPSDGHGAQPPSDGHGAQPDVVVEPTPAAPPLKTGTKVALAVGAVSAVGALLYLRRR